MSPAREKPERFRHYTITLREFETTPFNKEKAKGTAAFRLIRAACNGKNGDCVRLV
ncbi:hypothetical protein REMIM1_PE00491 (plasmid) [Rhizobium etli bv. mimosae str. Mim1]|nr:hypothetical protein REMIM1_PE00491 [Rhizobium etli bv. mimosae str. Mim1]